MPDIVVRKIPDEMKTSLETLARKERRSVNQTVIIAIENYLALSSVPADEERT